MCAVWVPLPWTTQQRYRPCINSLDTGCFIRKQLSSPLMVAILEHLLGGVRGCQHGHAAPQRAHLEEALPGKGTGFRGGTQLSAGGWAGRSSQPEELHSKLGLCTILNFSGIYIRSSDKHTEKLPCSSCLFPWDKIPNGNRIRKERACFGSWFQRITVRCGKVQQAMSPAGGACGNGYFSWQ